MNTITFATTRMNLINCVEYLSTIKSQNILIVDSASCARKKQMKAFLRTPIYARMFEKIIYRNNSNNRFLEAIFTSIYHIKLFILSRVVHVDKIISGNYLCCGSRLLYSYLPKDTKYIACDDGTGTIEVATQRISEYDTQNPLMYIPNRLLKKIIHRNPTRYIPQSITFFTNYSITPNGKDVVIRHGYTFLKQHLQDFNVDASLFSKNVIVLGEPLYFKNFVTQECYAKKLKLYAGTVEGTVLYYAHPEETKFKWDGLQVHDKYVYVDNFLPFEIIAALLQPNCRVAAFMCSALMNIREVNDQLIPECIRFKRDEVLPKFNYDYAEKLYDNYKSIGVTFYEFD